MWEQGVAYHACAACGNMRVRSDFPHDCPGGIELTPYGEPVRVDVYHCLRCNHDVPAAEVHDFEWMPGRVGTFHSCGDYAHPYAWEATP